MLVPALAVAPLAGAWIETDERSGRAIYKPSLPSRERGLKLADRYYNISGNDCRSPHGSVD